MSEIRGISELLAVLDEELKHRSITWFRGHRDTSWDVIPTVLREYTEAEERDFTNRFRSRSGGRYSEAVGYWDCAKWLGLMQHYGLPTRLLDWSRSPLIAAYFALEKFIYDPEIKPETDACIWLLDPHVMNYDLVGSSVTPQIDAKMCEDFVWPAFAEPGPKNQRDPKHFDNAIAVMASEYDTRMFVQQGAFTVHSRRAPLTSFEGHEAWLKKLTVPASSIQSFAREVRLCGFRRGDIFPDLQNLSDEIKWNHKLGSLEYREQ